MDLQPEGYRYIIIPSLIVYILTKRYWEIKVKKYKSGLREEIYFWKI